MMDKNKIAMGLFILSESVFFLLLLLAYVALHRAMNTGPNAANSLDVVKTGIFSLFLFSSSATMWRAEVAMKAEQRARMGWWLAGTILLGAVFLIGQGMEYADLILNHVTISRDVFGTTFFTLTGFHGLHVFIGLILLSTLLGIALGSKHNQPKEKAVGTVSMYWHFVDAVWVFIFSVVYLWGRL